MVRTLYRTKFVGIVDAISSKSHAHRLLIAAAFYGKRTKIKYNGALSEDIMATIKCLQALNIEIEVTDNAIFVSGMDNKVFKNNFHADLYCGESGSTMRFMIPIVCALGIDAAFYPEGRLSERPLSPLREELIRHGCNIDPVGTKPFKTSGKLRGGIFEIAGNISSQYVTGLLLALPLIEDCSEIHIKGKLESRPYVNMTLEVLSHFGVYLKIVNDSLILVGGKRTNILKDAEKVLTFSTEGDWSNAAFWLTAGAVGEDKLCVSGLDTESQQGDKAILNILKRFGAHVEIDRDEVTVFPDELHATDIDAADIPDLVPILTLAASCAKGTTVIYNAQRLRLKESDRLKTVHNLFSTLGGNIEITDDGLIIKGTRKYKNTDLHRSFPLRGGSVDSFNDHRIAMTAAIASLVCREKITLSGTEAVNKSYPNFWKDFNRLNQN